MWPIIGPMEGLWGSLGTMPIRDLLEYCAKRQMHATLVCESGALEKNLVLRKGSLVRASSSDPREFLGQFLLNYGHINEEQLEQAFRTQQETKVFLGRILVMIGLVEESVIQNVLALKLRETVLDLLCWDHGQFHLSPDPEEEDDPSIDVEIPLDDILEEAEFRQVAWNSIRQIFPHEGIRLKVSPVVMPNKLEDPLDIRILELAMEDQSIAEIALTLHATPFALHQRLLALHRAGVLNPVVTEEAKKPEATDVPLPGASEATGQPSEEEAAVPTTLGKEATVEEIVAQARDFLAKGRYAEARSVAMRAVEVGPQDDSAHSMLKEAEMGMLAELREKLLETPRIPRVTLSQEELKKREFTPAERYLLKRFDGTKPLSTVLKISPIKEVEALWMVNSLISAGIVNLEPPP